MTQDEWISTAEAAQMLGFASAANVRKLVSQKRLSAEKRGRDLWLRRRDVEAFAAVPRRSGRPKRDATAGE